MNEFDHDGEGTDDRHLQAFVRHYLAAGERGIDYPYHYLAPVNTGLAGPRALDGGPAPELPGDGLGFGAFHGQYGFAILSRLPLLTDKLRTFRRFYGRTCPALACLKSTADPFTQPRC
ncbi:hypothetical protein MBH78_05680 [Oceanimonas sp. NS1]|nr:hypothetical protein [Oceanimonas sp. NS1]